MRILLGYSYYKNPFDVKEWINKWLSRINSETLYVESFCLTLNPPGPRLLWKDLDAMWKRGDKDLLDLYKNLAEKLDGFDVFLNWNGINMHPEFVKQLPTINVYGCFDDPESSENLSKPVAWCYDLCMVGNIAEVDTYKKWGVKNARFWPMGFFETDYDPALTYDDIINGTREVDVTLLCERTSGWRAERLDKYSNAFPQGKYFGSGWKAGFYPEDQKVKLYQNTKIGPNFHNSTGPINFRTYMLPANGVMLLCDNKSHLSEIFKLNEEAIGFDTVEEAIELTKYYLEHDDERRRIAAAGWKRAVACYNERAVMDLLLKAIKEANIKKKDRSQNKISDFLIEHSSKTNMKRLIYPVVKSVNSLRDQFYIFRKRIGLIK